ncbi:ABC transporter permease [Amphibiibacter pelophylacis]|uniref:ABC transporter permease n=1 Tax=Amphibiibacter pelophylacis TaxID=1799477 RepID=A0ACC6P1L6_9BURK
MWTLEARTTPPRVLRLLSPVFALVLTLALGTALFAALGKPPLQALQLFLIQPWSSLSGLSELSIKAVPLTLLALGLALCFRSNVWNIGAEGQFVLGALAAGWVSMQAGPDSSGPWWILVLLAGMVGGMLWAALVALLRDRFNANEILVSLMLVYVAILLLQFLMYGPWKDPQGYNFPQSITFAAATQLPRPFQGLRLNLGVLLIPLAAIGLWALMFRTVAGFAWQVGGLAPAAARYAGFSSRQALWGSLLVCGALAGLAGAVEVAGPLRQLTLYVPAGYGFAAIIVAFVGRLHPLGIVLAGILMSLFYIGGELAQTRMGLPKSMTTVFQGVLLFMLLLCDALIHYRLVRRRSV